MQEFLLNDYISKCFNSLVTTLNDSTCNGGGEQVCAVTPIDNKNQFAETCKTDH